MLPRIGSFIEKIRYKPVSQGGSVSQDNISGLFVTFSQEEQTSECNECVSSPIPHVTNCEVGQSSRQCHAHLLCFAFDLQNFWFWGFQIWRQLWQRRGSYNTTNLHGNQRQQLDERRSILYKANGIFRSL